MSVIVCSYNGGKTLGDCLRALDQVDYPHYEIVLVDDGSKDNTQEVDRGGGWRDERCRRPLPGSKTSGSPTWG